MTAIARAYADEAKELRRKAQRLERRAAGLFESVEAGRTITLEQVCEAIHSDVFVADRRARKLAAIKDTLSKQEALDRALGLTRALPPEVAVTKAPASATMPDALNEAIAIVRSANCDEIDWSREPLSDRERRVRERYLANALEAGVAGGCRLNALHLRLLARGLAPAADLQRAIDADRRRLDEEHAAHERQHIQRAIEGVEDDS